MRIARIPLSPVPHRLKRGLAVSFIVLSLFAVLLPAASWAKGGPAQLSLDPSTPGPRSLLTGGPVALAYSGYIGGSDTEYGIAIAVDAAGNAYVTGPASSNESTFPVTVGPDPTYNNGIHDAFVAKLEADGTGLVYAGYLGGQGDDRGFGIATDAAGNAYVTGETSSTEATFPVMSVRVPPTAATSMPSWPR